MQKAIGRVPLAPTRAVPLPVATRLAPAVAQCSFAAYAMRWSVSIDSATHRPHCRRRCCFLPAGAHPKRATAGSRMSLSPALQPLLQQLTSLRGFLPACSSALLGSRGYAAGGRGSGGSVRDAGDDDLPAVNPKFRCVHVTCKNLLPPAYAAAAAWSAPLCPCSTRLALSRRCLIPTLARLLRPAGLQPRWCGPPPSSKSAVSCGSRGG